MNTKQFCLTMSVSLLALAGCSKEPVEAVVQEAQVFPEETASLTTLYINADIVTVDEAQPSAEAVAVRDGMILAVGSRSAVEAVSGDKLEIRDLAGKTLMPGFIDAHGHITMTNKMQASANISSPPVGSAKTIDDILALLRAHRELMPDAPWLTAWGYDESLLVEGRHPTREDLDKVSTEIPIVLQHVSGHFVTCNSRALALAGITADTVAPQGGVIRRMPDSREPNGVLEEQAFGLVVKIMPVMEQKAALGLMTKTQAYYASNGITTVQDGASTGNEIDLLQSAAEAGLLYLDVVTFPYAPYMEGQLEKFPPSRQYDNHFRVGGIKLVLDGSPQGKTAWMTKPYLHVPHGQPEDYAGYPTLKDEQVAGFVDYAFSNSVPLLAHANGDAAADQLINAVSAANEKLGKADRRPVMIHAQTVREDQIDKMISAGIVPSYFVAHTFYWGDWHRDSVFGVERASRISPLRSSKDKGLRYTVHNDTPVVPPDMMRLLWSAVTRVTRSGVVLGADQRATVMEGIKAMTLDAAYQYFEEGSKGSIEVGKRADFVVLAENPLTVDPMAIKDILVLETIKDGATVFSR
ncbi:MAG: amidohydrolase [Halioglobus sp.]